jgi:hypothetical protein
MNILFSLIKRLNKSEKRRFKLNSLKKSGENQYLILFEFMDSMSSEDEEYSEEKLIGLLEKEDFFKKNKKQETNASYLRAMQFYLKDQILKTLRILYEGEKKPSYLVYINLINAELANRKSLDGLTQKEIKKAIALAKKFDLTEDLFHIKRIQIGMTHSSSDKNILKRINDLHQEKLQLLEQMRIETEYSHLYYKLYYLYSEGFRYSKNTKELEQLGKEVAALDLKIASNNFHTHYIFFKIKAYFYLLINKVEKAFEYLDEALKLWEKRKEFIQKYPMRYQALMSDYLNICVIANKCDENYDSLLKKMKTLKVNNHKDDVSNQAMIIQIELLRMMNTNSFDETIDFAKEADQFLLKYKDEVPDTKQFTFQYNIMILYFMMEDYENALIRSEKLLNFKNKKTRKDLKAKTMMFYLIFLYERDKEELANLYLDKENDEYWDAIAGARGKLRRQKQHNDFHRLLQRCLLKMTFVYSPESLRIEFYEMRSKLSELKEKIGDKNIGGLGIEEALYWIENKITGKSIRDIMQGDTDDE